MLCILWLQQPNESDDSWLSHQHRMLCILWLPQPDRSGDSQLCANDWGDCVSWNSMVGCKDGIMERCGTRASKQVLSWFATCFSTSFRIRPPVKCNGVNKTIVVLSGLVWKFYARVKWNDLLIPVTSITSVQFFEVLVEPKSPKFLLLLLFLIGLFWYTNGHFWFPSHWLEAGIPSRWWCWVVLPHWDQPFIWTKSVFLYVLQVCPSPGNHCLQHRNLVWRQINLCTVSTQVWPRFHSKSAVMLFRRRCW